MIAPFARLFEAVHPRAIDSRKSLARAIAVVNCVRSRWPARYRPMPADDGRAPRLVASHRLRAPDERLGESCTQQNPVGLEDGGIDLELGEIEVRHRAVGGGDLPGKWRIRIVVQQR